MGERSRRVAIFGGTFDPFHNGHLRMAVEVLERLPLTDLFLVPSARPPHKPSRPMAPAEDRLAMASAAVPAIASDWGTEYLDLILAVRVVPSMDAAMEHIRKHGSLHTEAILTRDHARAMRFLREVDSASVMVNASTRFADGFEYGLGAEIGISTDKFHARGPCGLQELCSYKYIVYGDGQVRE